MAPDADAGRRAYPKSQHGIDLVLDRKEACAALRTAARPDRRSRCGLGRAEGPRKVIGTSRDKHDLSGLKEPLRSHGGLTEQEVPIIVNRKIAESRQALRNFDAFSIGCNHIAATPSAE